MISKGFNPGKIVADGTWRRFDTIKRGDRSGYYNYNGNGAGCYGDFKTGREFLFREHEARPITEQERSEIHARLKENARKAREQTENRQAKAASYANKLWESAAPAAADNVYLARKAIQPHIARQMPDGRLIIPICDDGKIVSLQFIAANGSKKMLTGGKKGGCFSVLSGENRVVFVAEGYATAASIYEATGCETIIAFDAGNMEKVAGKVRKNYGDTATIIIAGDNDERGTAAAQIAATDAMGEVKTPQGISGKDWNDAAAEFGLSWVRDNLMPQLPAVIEPAQHAVTAERDLTLELDANGNPKCIKENISAICEARGIILRYNCIAKRQEILIPGSSYSLDNGEGAAFAHVLSECKREGMSTAHVHDYLVNLCDQNLYNPVANWILSKPWDGTDRLLSFFGSIVQEGEADNQRIIDAKETKIKRWMISAVAAAFSSGISAHGVLVLQGKQNLGKTHWFKKLVPPDIEAIKDGFILRIDDKDSLYQCLSHWLVELGELDATFKKSDIAQMKAFLTSDRDIIRLPYAAKKSNFPRRTIFFASVNQREFLHDETGNRRFWVIPCESINFNHGLDMQQVWAQFYALWRGGEGYILTPDEMAAVNEENEGFASIDSVYERIAKYYDWKGFDRDWLYGNEANWKTSTQICREIGIINPSNGEAQKASNAVKKMNGGLSKRLSGSSGGGARVLLVPYSVAGFAP